MERDDLEARQRRLVDAVWENGIPESDRIVLESVPAVGRARLLDRLEAVWRAENGEPLEKLAKLAGLKRAAFYNLRSAWKRNSLAGLVPHDTRAGRKVDAKPDDPLRNQVAKMLRANPTGRNVDVARAVIKANPALEAEGKGPNFELTVRQRLQRLVREERRRLSADPSFVRAAYGSQLVLDLTAVQIVVQACERHLAVASILLETASGLIMGTALGAREEGPSLQIAALSEGLSFLERERADLPIEGDAKPRLGWMVPHDLDARSLSDDVAPYVARLNVGRVGGYSFGQQVVQAVGPRIGRTPLIPRRTSSADEDVEKLLRGRIAPVVTLEEAQAIWRREVARHNVDRIDALTKAGVIGDGVSDGRLAVIMRTLIAALQPG